jgi:ATP-dependent DNA helicase 2 subunit 1
MRQNKDSVVFLIDCHKSNHEKNPHNGEGQPSNLEQVIKACLSFMKTKIITSDNDKIGIVLYGCKETSNSLNFQNINVMQKLDSPDAAAIKSVEKRIATFSQDFGHAREGLQVPLFEAFWICH